MNGCNTGGRRRIITVLRFFTMNSGDNSVTTLKSQTFIFPVKYCPKPSHCLIV
ncbi:unnamed protein product [Ectocarpus sp. CCAP 1310/34]|nr:unnamed protein product [Ectocarpus sp. CCAP 1310/34]